MNWLQISFVVNAGQVEKLSGLLETFLAQAITTENAGADECYEVAFPKTPSWEKVKVTALFGESAPAQDIVDFVITQFKGDESTEIPVSIEAVKDQDWERVWLQSFSPIQVGDQLWVCPSWQKPVDPKARNIILDPGLAFGTGTHATTAMCLNWISTHNLSQQTVLDYGSGSGILAIATLLCGAKEADAVDIDPLAVQACKENGIRNGLDSKLGCYLNTNHPDRQYDLVIANILADVIVELKDTLLLHLEHRGKLLLTGILETQADKVIAAYSRQCRDFEVIKQDQWCLITAKRH